MADLPVQPVSVFFGATDQDTSKKGVKLGDLILARDTQQVKGGEFSKRPCFTATAQTYTGKSSITPDGFCSPDGQVKIVRDAVDDVAYAQGPLGGAWTSRGGAQRLLCKTAIRFPSMTSTKQQAPLFKQAGQWFVWLDDEQHFRVAKQDTDGTRLAYISAPIAVNGPKGAGDYPSTHVKSFCVVNNPAFDGSNLWVFWVDWSTNAGAQQNRDGVWALKVPIDGSATSQLCIQAGTVANKHILTGITATYAGSALWLAQCGIYLSAGDAVDFRSSSAGEIDGYCQHFKVDNGGTVTGLLGHVITSTSRSWTASGITFLTSPSYTYQAGVLFYTFWTQDPSNDSKIAALVLIKVQASDSSVGVYVLDRIDLSTTILPATLTIAHNFVGMSTGREHSLGCYVVASVRASASNSGTQTWADVGSNTADRIFTRCYDYRIAAGGSVSVKWEKRGAWLAHGVFKRSDGNEFVITGWQDTDEVQMPYHLRRFTDGEIVTQFAYGEAAYPGGCGSLTGQFVAHVNDLQQPYLCDQGYLDPSPRVVLAATSANVAETVDLVALSVSRPSYQGPAADRGLALAPGGVPTIAGGWQSVQEAGPLVYPGKLQSFWGEGSS